MAELIAPSKRRAGKALVDVRTPVHFGTGVVGGLLGVDASVIVLTVIAYEAVRDTMKKDAHRALFQPGSAEVRINQAMDVGVTMLGAYVGERMRTARLAKQAAAQQPPPAPVAGPIAVSGSAYRPVWAPPGVPPLR